MQYARAAFEVAEAGANMEIWPAWQVAETEDSPGNTKALTSSAVTGKDVYYPDGWTDVSGDSTAPGKSNMIVRFGWLVKKASTHAGLACATVAGVVEYQLR